MAWFGKSAKSLSSRGAAYAMKGQIDRAIVDFDEAIRLDPKYADAFYNRGIAYAETGQYNRALADFDEAIRLNPKNADFFANRGSAYVIRGQHDRAIADYDEAIRLNPRHTPAINRRAATIAITDRGDAAAQPYERTKSEVQAMITEQEFYSVLVKHPNVEAALDKAVHAMTEMARGVEKSGLFAKMRLARLTFDNARAMSELLTLYGTATGYRRPTSDIDYVKKIVFMAAKNPDRKFDCIMRVMAGINLSEG